MDFNFTQFPDRVIRSILFENIEIMKPNKQIHPHKDTHTYTHRENKTTKKTIRIEKDRYHSSRNFHYSFKIQLIAN